MRKYFSCLMLLFLFMPAAACSSLRFNNATVIFDSDGLDQPKEPVLASENPPVDNGNDAPNPSEGQENDPGNPVSEPADSPQPAEESPGPDLTDSLAAQKPEEENVTAPPETIDSTDPLQEVIGEPERVPPDHDIGSLSNDSLSWYYMRNYDHVPPPAQGTVDLGLYDAHYLGDTSKKIVYLTFDPGYEIGLTGQILDTLLEKYVSAAFFLTRTYIRDEPELVQRMVTEGHVPANHSATHPAFPTLTDEEIAKELNETAQLFADTTGYPMDPFFRPPAGVFSERTLALTNELGYTTVFWSFAHVDWIVDDQPPAEVTHDKVLNELHNGMVILLHVVSESNTLALPSIIDDIRAQGYEFGSLHDLRD